MDVIVLAGGGTEPGLDPTLPNKAFITVAGRPLVAHVVAALERTASIERIGVVGPPDALRPVLPGTVTLVPSTGGIVENLVRGVEAMAPQGLTLVVASDLPLLTPLAIEEVIDACEAEDADLYYPMVPQDVMHAQFPAAQKRFVRLAEGTFYPASMMIFNPQVLPRVRPFVERVIEARKKPLQVAQLLGGWPVFLRLYTGRLSIADIVNKAMDVVGIRIQPVIVDLPEIALDVDVGKPENLDIIRRVFGSPEEELG